MLLQKFLIFKIFILINLLHLYALEQHEKKNLTPKYSHIKSTKYQRPTTLSYNNFKQKTTSVNVKVKTTSSIPTEPLFNFKSLNRTLNKIFTTGKNGRLVLLFCKLKCLKERAEVCIYLNSFYNSFFCKNLGAKMD